MRQRSVSTADNGASYEDNGIGLYRRKTTAAAEIDDDAIGGSISLVRGSKHQSTDDLNALNVANCFTRSS